VSVVTNGLTNSIVKLKMEEYKKDLSKFENGVSRKFTFSDTSIVTGREIKFFPINMIEAMHKLKKISGKTMDKKWAEMSKGCKPSVDLFSLGTGVAGIKDSPAVREAVYNCGITDIPTLKHISEGGMAALDSVTYMNPVQSKMRDIYDELHKKNKMKETVVYKILERPKLSMDTLKMKFNKTSRAAYNETDDVSMMDIPEELKNSQFFKDLEVANTTNLRREKRKPRLSKTKETM
jgi:hypothetical protein